MRKLILLAAVIALVALVLILVNALGTRASVAPLNTEPETHPTIRAPAPLDPDKDNKGDRLARENANTPSTGSPTATTGSASLRIRISFAGQSDHQPHGLEVRVSDLLGVQRGALRASPLEFVVPGLDPGEYLVAAEEEQSIGATVHANVIAADKETLIELSLQPRTRVRVRWRSSEGQPITTAVGEHISSEHEVLLGVRATAVPVFQDSPPGALAPLDSIDLGFDLVPQPGEDRYALRPALNYKTNERRPWPPADDVFGELLVPARPPFWISAWSNGVLLDHQEVSEHQDEVVIVSSVNDLAPARVPVSFCIVDDATGQPIDDVWVKSEQSRHVGAHMETDPPGCGTIRLDAGWAVLDFQQTVGAGDRSDQQFALCSVRVQVRPGQPLDLGTLRVSLARKARYRVLDGEGKTVDHAEFMLIRSASYDGSAAPGDLRRTWSDPEGVLTFGEVASEHYAVICSAPRVDATPFVLDGARIAVGDERILGDIVVRPVRQISLVFDDPPRAGTLMMIETPEGLPVRTLEMDEFGVVPLWLGGTDYRIHLVEDGSPTPSVPLTIDSDPCIRRIHR